MGKAEAIVELGIYRYAEFCGWWQIKIEQCGEPGMPDRLLIKRGELDRGVCAFIEVKKKDEKPQKHQARKIQKLRDHGIDAIAADSVEMGREFIDELERKYFGKDN